MTAQTYYRIETGRGYIHTQDTETVEQYARTNRVTAVTQG